MNADACERERERDSSGIHGWIERRVVPCSVVNLARIELDTALRAAIALRPPVRGGVGDSGVRVVDRGGAGAAIPCVRSDKESGERG